MRQVLGLIGFLSIMVCILRLFTCDALAMHLFLCCMYAM